METEIERVMPLFCHSLTELAEGGEAEELKAQQGLKDGAPAEAPAAFSSWGSDAEGNPVSEWDYLNNFFKRFNKVTLDHAAVERERARLVGENGQLRAALKMYLDDLAVNEDVMSDRFNSLLKVGTQTLQPAGDRSMKRSPDAPPVLVLVGAHVR